MSLPDQLERAGIVLGSILMVSLPASIVLSVLTGTSTPWWSTLLLVIPGFVVGWTVATERSPFDYDSLWFVCIAGYLGTLAAVAALGLEATEGDGVIILGVGVGAFFAAALVDRYRG